MATELIGWMSVAVLLVTLVHQAYLQWREHAAAVASRGLFAGQVCASGGLVTYSLLVGNSVFLAASLLVLLAALAGRTVILRNRRQVRHATPSRVVQVSRREFRAGARSHVR